MTVIAAVNTGTSGTIYIDDDGTYIRLYIRNTQGATFASGKAWSVSFSGIGNDAGSFSISGAQTIQVGGNYAPGFSQSVTFTMGATGTSGLGGPTSVSANIFRATVPPAPTPVGVNQATYDSLRYQFTYAGDGGSPILEWQAIRAADPSFSTDVVIVGSGGTTTFTGLGRVKPYYFASRGRNAVGWGPWSYTISGTTLAAPPTVPRDLALEIVGPGQVILSWTPPADNGGKAITGYGIEWSRQSNFSTIENKLDVNGSAAFATLTVSSPGEIYYFRIRTANVDYAGPWATISILVASGARVYNGTSWRAAVVKVWTGTQWKVAKVWVCSDAGDPEADPPVEPTWILAK